MKRTCSARFVFLFYFVLFSDCVYPFCHFNQVKLKQTRQQHQFVTLGNIFVEHLNAHLCHRHSLSFDININSVLFQHFLNSCSSQSTWKSGKVHLHLKIESVWNVWILFATFLFVCIQTSCKFVIRHENLSLKMFSSIHTWQSHLFVCFVE